MEHKNFSIKAFIFSIIMVMLLTLGWFFIKGNDYNQKENFKTYRLYEISKHNTTKDCWVIYNDKIYNLSNVKVDENFSLEFLCGKNITSIIKNYTLNNIYFEYFETLFEDKIIGKVVPANAS